MNNNLSLKEGFSFLFEENEQEEIQSSSEKEAFDINLIFSGELQSNSDQEAILNILLCDIIFSYIENGGNLNQTSLQKAFSNREESNIPVKNLLDAAVIGRGFDFKTKFNKSLFKNQQVLLNHFQGVKRFNFVQEEKFKNLIKSFIESIDYLSNKNVSKIILEQSDITIKIAKGPFSILISRISKQKSLLSKNKTNNILKINIDKIYELLNSESNKLIKNVTKSDRSKSYKWDGLNRSQKIAVSLKNYIETKLKPSDIKNIRGGLTGLRKVILGLYDNSEDSDETLEKFKSDLFKKLDHEKNKLKQRKVFAIKELFEVSEEVESSEEAVESVASDIPNNSEEESREISLAIKSGKELDTIESKGELQTIDSLQVSKKPTIEETVKDFAEISAVVLSAYAIRLFSKKDDLTSISADVLNLGKKHNKNNPHFKGLYRHISKLVHPDSGVGKKLEIETEDLFKLINNCKDNFESHNIDLKKDTLLESLYGYKNEKYFISAFLLSTVIDEAFQKFHSLDQEPSLKEIHDFVKNKSKEIVVSKEETTLKIPDYIRKRSEDNKKEKDVNKEKDDDFIPSELDLDSLTADVSDDLENVGVDLLDQKELDDMLADMKAVKDDTDEDELQEIDEEENIESITEKEFKGSSQIIKNNVEEIDSFKIHELSQTIEIVAKKLEVIKNQGLSEDQIKMISDGFAEEVEDKAKSLGISEEECLNISQDVISSTKEENTISPVLIEEEDQPMIQNVVEENPELEPLLSEEKLEETNTIIKNEMFNSIKREDLENQIFEQSYSDILGRRNLVFEALNKKVFNDKLMNFVLDNISAKLDDDEKPFSTDQIDNLDYNIDEFKNKFNDFFKDKKINIDFIILEISEVFSSDEELKTLFDALFETPLYLYEDNWKKEYFKNKLKELLFVLITKAFDSAIDPTKGRIVESKLLEEGVLDNIKSAVSAGLSNLKEMAPALAIVGSIVYGVSLTFYGPAIIAACTGLLGAYNIINSIKSIADFEKARNDYGENPIKFITDIISKDKNAQQVTRDIVLNLSCDLLINLLTRTEDVMGQTKHNVIKKLNDYKFKRDSISDDEFKNLRSGLDYYSGKKTSSVIVGTMISQVERYNNFDEDYKEKLRWRRLYLQQAFEKTNLYKNKLVSDNLINDIFNFSFLSIDNTFLLDNENNPIKGIIDQEKVYEFIKEKTSFENKVKFYIEDYCRKNASILSNNERFKFENETGKKPTQLFVSKEKLTDNFFLKLLKDMLGEDLYEYYAPPIKNEMQNRKRNEERDPTEKYDDLLDTNIDGIKENIIFGNLSKLLFEDTNDSLDNEEINDSEKSFDKNKIKIKSGFLSSLTPLDWAGNLYQSITITDAVKDSVKMSKVVKEVPPEIKTITELVPTEIQEKVLKFCETPTEAIELNELGFDPTHALIEGINPYGGHLSRLHFYYNNNNDLCAQLHDTVTDEVKQLGGGDKLFAYFEKNKAWAQKFGVSLDSQSKTASAIGDGNLLEASSQEMAETMSAIKTGLIGSYPTSVEASQLNMKSLNLNKFIEFFSDSEYVQQPIDMKEIGVAFYKYNLTQENPGGFGILFDDTIKKLFKDPNISQAEQTERAKQASLRIKEFMENAKFAQEKKDLAIKSSKMLNDPKILSQAHEDFSKELKFYWDNSIGKLNYSWLEKVDQKSFIKVMGQDAQEGFNPILKSGVKTITKNIEVTKEIEVDSPPTEIIAADVKSSVIDFYSTPTIFALSKVLGPTGLISKVISKFYTRGVNGAEVANLILNTIDFSYMIAHISSNIISDLTPDNRVYDIFGPGGTAEYNPSIPEADDRSLFPNPNLVKNQETSFNIQDLNQFEIPEVREDLDEINQANESYIYELDLSSFLFENKSKIKK